MTDDKKEIKTYRLKEAVDKAFEKFMSLDERMQTPVNMVVVAREYAPKTIKQVQEVMNEFPEFFMAEMKPGYYVLDGLIATITYNIGQALSEKYLEEINERNGRNARNQILIPGR